MTQPNTLQDPMESSGPSGPPQAPTITLASLGRKTWLKGIIVPSDVNGELKPYRVAQQRSYPGNLPLFFTNDDGSQGKPRTQLVITLLTDLRDWAGTTDSFKDKLEEAEKNGDDVPVDVGLRRVVIKSGKPLTGAKEVLAAAGVSNFEIGGTYGIQQQGKEKPKQGEEAQPYILEHFYEKATASNRDKAQEVFDKYLKRDDATQSNDPMAGGAGNDEPPF